MMRISKAINSASYAIGYIEQYKILECKFL